MSLPRRLSRFDTSDAFSGSSEFSIASEAEGSTGSSVGNVEEIGFWLDVVDMCNSNEGG